MWREALGFRTMGKGASSGEERIRKRIYAHEILGTFHVHMRLSVCSEAEVITCKAEAEMR